MKTTIEFDNEKLHINNDDLEGYNCVELQFEYNKGAISEPIVVLLSDIISALQGFQKQYKLNKESDL